MLKFSLVDSKKSQGSKLMLEQIGIEIHLRKQNLTLPPNKVKALCLRIVKTPTLQTRIQNLTATKESKTAIVCLIAKLNNSEQSENVTCLESSLNYKFTLRLNY